MDAAIAEFTEHGYTGTDAVGLCERAGIARSSFYSTFSSKDALFERALARYTGRGVDEREALLASPDPAPVVLRRRFTDTLGDQCAREDRAGCLSVNTAVELGRSMDGVTALLDADRGAWIDAYARILARGREEGHVRPDVDPETFGPLVHTTLAGLRVAARVATPQEVRAQLDAFLDALSTDAGRTALADAPACGSPEPAATPAAEAHA
ncbi:TetR family transcriptional regulator [Luteimicrobium album]|uniref:TetR family transcriptional regulator n=1 Tax=Luteimicrobium album TaxID=1054550 RepID=A0ABQ6I1H0_9MICO|nr:TetR family transcriptional regulator [Luteimicrobium album]